MKIFDIGANLLDGMFHGIYHSRQCHPPDLPQVLKRAQRSHLTGVIVTAGDLNESKESLKLISALPDCGLKLFTTVGIHPTKASEFLATSRDLVDSFLGLAQSHKVVAIGECGLDYAREQFSNRSDQIAIFKQHFKLAKASGKPMFLHLRDAFDDFYAIVRDHRADFVYAVVHSFDGTVEQAQMLLDMGLFIGINGCSLRTLMGIEVVQHVPLEKLMVESDAPWCELRPSHASSLFSSLSHEPKRDKDRWSADCWVKGRNEPAACLNVCEVISKVKGIPIDEVSEIIYNTTTSVFNIL